MSVIPTVVANATAMTPFGAAPVQQDASEGMLVASASTDSQGNLNDAPAIAPFGLPQVAVAPTVAPVNTQPTAVFCQADEKIYVFNLATSTWVSTAAL